MLTRTIVHVGHDLGIEIVAEGIERPEQLELLRAMGCGLGQGYLVARPMTAPGIESLAVLGGRGPAATATVVVPGRPAPGDRRRAGGAPPRERPRRRRSTSRRGGFRLPPHRAAS